MVSVLKRHACKQSTCHACLYSYEPEREKFQREYPRAFRCATRISTCLALVLVRVESECTCECECEYLQRMRVCYCICCVARACGCAFLHERASERREFRCCALSMSCDRTTHPSGTSENEKAISSRVHDNPKRAPWTSTRTLACTLHKELKTRSCKQNGASCSWDSC